jgi:hypothetical protein
MSTPDAPGKLQAFRTDLPGFVKISGILDTQTFQNVAKYVPGAGSLLKIGEDLLSSGKSALTSRSLKFRSEAS